MRWTGAEPTQVPARVQRIARCRSLAVLASFTAAMLVAFVMPRVGFGLICAALVFLPFEARCLGYSLLAASNAVFLMVKVFVAADCQSKTDSGPEAQV